MYSRVEPYTYATEKVCDERRLNCSYVSLAPPLLNPGSAPAQSNGAFDVDIESINQHFLTIAQKPIDDVPLSVTSTLSHTFLCLAHAVNL